MSYWDSIRIGVSLLNTSETQARFTKLADHGIPLARLSFERWATPLQFGGHDFMADGAGDLDSYEGISSADFAALDMALGYAAGAGVRIVLALRSLPGARWLGALATPAFDARIYSSIMFTNLAAAYWRDLATLVKGYAMPDGSPLIVGYELLASPWADASDLAINDCWFSIITAIRTVDPSTPIIISPGAGGTSAALPALTLDLPNTIIGIRQAAPDPWLAGDDGAAYPGWINGRYWDRIEIERETANFARLVAARGPARAMVTEFFVNRHQAGAELFLADQIARWDELRCHWFGYRFDDEDSPFDDFHAAGGASDSDDEFYNQLWRNTLGAAFSYLPSGAVRPPPDLASPPGSPSPAPMLPLVRMPYWQIPRRGFVLDDATETEARIDKLAGLSQPFARLIAENWASGTDWLADGGDINAYSGLDAGDVATLETALGWADDAGLPIVYSIASLPGAKWYALTGDPIDLRLWQTELFTAQASAFVRDIAGVIAAHSSIAAFQIGELPAGATGDIDPATWRLRWQDLIAAVRAADSQMPIVLSCRHGDIADLPNLPADDPLTLFGASIVQPFPWTEAPDTAVYPGLIHGVQWEAASLPALILAPLQAAAAAQGIAPGRIILTLRCNRASPGAAAYLADLTALLSSAGFHWAIDNFDSDIAPAFYAGKGDDGSGDEFSNDLWNAALGQIFGIAYPTSPVPAPDRGI